MLAEVLEETNIDEYEDSALTATLTRKVDSDSLDCADGQMMLTGRPACWPSADLWEHYEPKQHFGGLLASVAMDFADVVLVVASRIGAFVAAACRLLLPKLAALCQRGYQAATQNGRYAPNPKVVSCVRGCASQVSKLLPETKVHVATGPAGEAQPETGTDGEAPQLVTQKGTWSLKEAPQTSSQKVDVRCGVVGVPELLGAPGSRGAELFEAFSESSELIATTAMRALPARLEPRQSQIHDIRSPHRSVRTHTACLEQLCSHPPRDRRGHCVQVEDICPAQVVRLRRLRLRPFSFLLCASPRGPPVPRQPTLAAIAASQQGTLSPRTQISWDCTSYSPTVPKS